MSRLIIAEDGLAYIDDTDWSKVNRCVCGAINNIHFVKHCLACGRLTQLAKHNSIGGRG